MMNQKENIQNLNSEFRIECMRNPNFRSQIRDKLTKVTCDILRVPKI
jgi:hypothetical protein